MASGCVIQSQADSFSEEIPATQRDTDPSPDNEVNEPEPTEPTSQEEQPQTYTLNVDIEGEGTVSSGEGSHTYEEGDGNTIVVPNLIGTEVKKNTQSTKRSSKNTYPEKGKIYYSLQKKFDELVEDDVEYSNGNKYRQIKFPEVPDHHHIEWYFGKENGNQVLRIQLDFEKSKAPDHNQELTD